MKMAKSKTRAVVEKELDDDSSIEHNDSASVKEYSELPNIILLICLYFFQGIPLGLVNSLPLILSSRRVSYADQGTFSFANWPFALKILWAPIIDSFYARKIGRRKTWIVFCTLASGIIFISISSFVEELLDSNRIRNKQDIYVLTLVFGVLIALAATQDIALDGWSLELLLSKNTMWQPLCNGIGIGSGSFFANALFLTLESEQFSNAYIRPFFGISKKSGGIISIKSFLLMFGVLAIIASVLILFFKSERNHKKLRLESERVAMKNVFDYVENTSVIEAYKCVKQIFSIKPIFKVIFILLTIRVGFFFFGVLFLLGYRFHIGRVLKCFRAIFKIGVSSENAIRLKLVEEGVAKENVSLLNVLISPMLLVFPFIFSKFVKGPSPLNVFMQIYPYKLLMVLVLTFFVFVTPYFKEEETGFSFSFYAVYFALNLVNSLSTYMFFVAIGSFQARIADKSIGGTYMTFLALWSNLGANLSRTMPLYLINMFSIRQCTKREELFLSNNFTTAASFTYANIEQNKCTFDTDIQNCQLLGGKCETLFDSFYLLSVGFVFIGLVWLLFARKYINEIQDVSLSEWSIIKHETALEENLDHNDKSEAKSELEEEDIFEARMKMTTSLEAVNDI